MNILGWVLIFTALVAVLSVLAAGMFMVLPRVMRDQSLPHLISFATGTLLGAAFIALLPHALEYPTLTDTHEVTITVLLGVLGFFLMQKMVLWRHCHHDACEAHAPAQGGQEHSAHIAGALILVGDSVHNLIHGILIAAAFLAEIHLGVVTSIAVVAHQIPQELGNFAVLLHRGFNRGRALLYITSTSLVAVVGGVLGYVGLAGVDWLIPYMLALGVSSCIYIAVADLIPGLHKRPQLNVTVQQVILISVGVGSIYLTHTMLH